MKTTAQLSVLKQIGTSELESQVGAKYDAYHEPHFTSKPFLQRKTSIFPEENKPELDF